MTADKRNTAVVFTLIAAMTLGLVVLLWLEEQLVPKKPRWSGSTLLMAERGMRVSDVEVGFAPTWAPESRNAYSEQDSVCLIRPDGSRQYEPLRERVHVVLVGASERSRLADAQKKMLQQVLGMLTESELSAHSGVQVRLAPPPDVAEDSGLAAQVQDLREFMQLKLFID